MLLQVAFSPFFLTSLVVGSSCLDGSDSCAASPTHGSAMLQKGAMLKGIHTHHDKVEKDISFQQNNGILHELMLLAGEAGQQWINLTGKGKTQTQDWTNNQTIEFPDPLSSGTCVKCTDTVKLYTKGQYDSCAVAFSAIDDDNDLKQAFFGAVSPVAYCGHTGINGGYVRVFENIQQARSKEWETMMNKLDKCGEVWSIGHSIGGGIASVFAFCKNSNHSHNERNHFKRLANNKTVKLFQISPLPVASSAQPLYNGEPGHCFEGLRIQSYVDMIPMNADVSIAIAEWVDQVYSLIPDFHTTLRIDQTKLKSDIDDMKTNKPFVPKMGEVVPGYNLLFSIVKNVPIPNLEFLLRDRDQLMEGLEQIAEKYAKWLAIPYDPVPFLSYHMDQVHPLVSTESVSLDGLKGMPNRSIVRNNCVDTVTNISETPSPDLTQALFGAAIADCPHHDICCLYSSWDACSEWFTRAREIDGAMSGLGVHCNVDPFSKNMLPAVPLSVR